MKDPAPLTPETFVRSWIIDNSRLLETIVESHLRRLGETAPKSELHSDDQAE